MEIEFEAGGVEVEVEVKGVRGWITLGGVALVAACLARELARPPAERTWHGSLFGLVPYDFRPPTLARLRATLWDPANPHLLVPTAFGAGWSLNLARLRSSLPPPAPARP
jgi:hypothetical protein